MDKKSKNETTPPRNSKWSGNFAPVLYILLLFCTKYGLQCDMSLKFFYEFQEKTHTKIRVKLFLETPTRFLNKLSKNTKKHQDYSQEKYKRRPKNTKILRRNAKNVPRSRKQRRKYQKLQRYHQKAPRFLEKRQKPGDFPDRAPKNLQI